MVFLVDATFAIELIALVLGGALLYFVKAHKTHHAFCKFISYFVIIVAFLSMACTTYYGTKYWMKGYYKKPFSMGKHRMFKKHKKFDDHKMEKRYPQKKEY